MRYKVLTGLPSDWWCDEEGASSRRQNIFIEKARELEAEGVRAITTGCGFFAKYQKAAAEALTVPLFNSPLLLVPMVSRMIGKGKRVGIISAGGSHLQGPFLENVGIDDTILFAIDGLEDKEEFTKVHVTQEKSTIDPEKMESEVVAVAERLVKAYPDHEAAYYHLGKAYNNLERYHEALFNFNKALELNPNDHRAKRMIDSIKEFTRYPEGPI